MGAVPTKSDSHASTDAVGEALIQLAARGQALPKSATQLPLFREFVEQCNAHRGLVLQRYTAESFRAHVTAEVPRFCEAFRRGTDDRGSASNGGKRRYQVQKAILYAVLETEADAKAFSQHMRGLEAMSFVAFPSVAVPRAALAYDAGLAVACMTLHHLQDPVAADNRSTHVATCRAVVSKVLRLRGEPAIVLYEGGDGNLVVVDATHLLPPLVLPTTAAGGGPPLYRSARAEQSIARDCSWAASPAPTMSLAVAAPGSLPFLSAVISSAAVTRKRVISVPTLHAAVACAVGPIQNGATGSSVDLSVRAVGLTSRPAPVVTSASVSFDHVRWDDYLPATRVTVTSALRAAVDRMETAGEDFSVTDVMHAAGVPINLLGLVWAALVAGNAAHGAPHAAQRVAIELVARSAKHWLRDRLRKSSDAAGQAAMLELFRSVHDADFVGRELVPIMAARYSIGVAGVPGLGASVTGLPFRHVMTRLRELTGVTVSQGAIASVAPRVRVARSAFSLTAAQELAIATAAVKRDDPMGVAATLAAAGLHARTAARITGVVAQLRSRRLDNPVLLLFVAALELLVVETELRNERYTEVLAVIERAVGSVMSCVASGPMHDRLFATRHGLRLVALNHRAGQRSVAYGFMVQLLELGALADLAQVGAAGCRQMLEEYYRSAADAFAHRGEEALMIAQTWARLCGPLFGPTSAQQCRATKMSLVGLVRCRRHSEALALAKEYRAQALRTFGPHDVHTAMAMNDVASLTWRRDPRQGLVLYQAALDVFRLSPAGARQVAPTLHNMGLAAAKINKLRQSIAYFNSARQVADAAHDMSTVASCDKMKRAVVDIAATKIQRWVRDSMYGVAPSQTSRTSRTSRTDLCSTLSWSDKDDVASTAGDILQGSGGLLPDPGSDKMDDFGSEHME